MTVQPAARRHLAAPVLALSLTLVLEDVRCSTAQPDLRPVLIADQVRTLRMEDVRYPPTPDGSPTLVLNGVPDLVWPDAGPRTNAIRRSP